MSVLLGLRSGKIAHFGTNHAYVYHSHLQCADAFYLSLLNRKFTAILLICSWGREIR